MKLTKNLLALTVSGALFGAAAVQAEVTLYDYEEGTSAYEEAYVSGDLNVTKNRDDDQAAYDLNLGLDYDKTLSSPSRDLTIKGVGNGNISRDGIKDAESVDSYVIGVSATADNYFTPGSNGAFWFGSASVRANDASDDLETTASVGVGYGRVTNVTPMAKTIRIMDELTKRGIMPAKPAKAVYQQVAAIIEKEDEYISKYGEAGGDNDYELKWLGDIETVLKNSGAAANLGAPGVLKMRDILIDERISLRRYGWKVRAGLGYLGTNFDGLKDKPLLTAGAEYHRPISNQTQFSDEATFNAIINDGDNGYNFNNQMTLTHEVDDRIDWENTWNLNYAKNTESGDDVTTNTLSSSFNYELNNTLDFTTTVRISNVDGSTAGADGTDRALLMGIRYRLR